MGLIEFLKEGFHEHKASGFKIILVVVAIVIFLFAGEAYDTSQKLKQQQTTESQSAVANHTQTLTEIENAVEQLKASNQADHTQTIKYINCVLVGVTGITPGTESQSQALSVYQTCLTENGAN